MIKISLRSYNFIFIIPEFDLCGIIRLCFNLHIVNYLAIPNTKFFVESTESRVYARRIKAHGLSLQLLA